MLEMSASSTNPSTYGRWRHVANCIFNEQRDSQSQTVHSFLMHHFSSSTLEIMVALEREHF